MEQWGVIIDTYAYPPDIRYFGKVLQTAGVVIKGDLAPFELEWIINTLFIEPVQLFKIISAKSGDDQWTKPVGDAFKLITEVVEKYPDGAERYYMFIVPLCQLPYDANTRKQALACLTAVARHSACAATDYRRHIAALEQQTVCKAPLAVLIGTICEHHPEIVADDVTTIWRIYLNLLDCNKNTEKISDSLLQGILGLFKNFGSDLPTVELNNFYNKMTKDYLFKGKCENVCLSIIHLHCGLFPERLSSDVTTRRRLWAKLAEHWSHAARVRDVYRTVFESVRRDGGGTQNLITEVQSHAQSIRSQVKFTALRILSLEGGAPDAGVDAHGLEFVLRTRQLSYDDTEALNWCIESGDHSETLLQTAVLFYHNLPSNRRKEIVVGGILNAPDHVRNMIINFLITESSQEKSAIDKFRPLWTDLFAENETRALFECCASYVVFVLNEYLEGDVGNTLPEQLSCLTTLTSLILTLQPPESFTEPHCEVLTPIIERLLSVNSCAEVAGLAHSNMAHAAAGEKIFELVNIDRCRDEALLVECCLIWLEAPLDTGRYVGDVASALQIIFSRNDVEPKTLSIALEKFETLILRYRDKLDIKSVAQSMRHLEKLRSRIDLTDKYGRILRKDLLLFMGKFGNSFDLNHTDSDQDVIVANLRDLLVLNIPNPYEGTNYKINLQRIFQLALVHGDGEALQTLMTIIVSQLSIRSEPSLQAALAACIVSICRTHAHGTHAHTRAVSAAVALCDTPACVRQILTHISIEKSPGLRKMLSDALEVLLTKDPGSDVTDTLLTTVAEQATAMMGSEQSTTKRAGLDISQTLIHALKDNNLLTKRLLPNILLLSAKTLETDSDVTFDIASTTYIEIIELFDGETNELIEILFEIIMNEKIELQNETDVKTYKKTVRMILEFSKRVLEYTKEDFWETIENNFHVFEIENDNTRVMRLYTLALLRDVFEMDTDLCRQVVTHKDNFLMDQLFCVNSDDKYTLEAVFMFMEQYAEVLLEVKYEKTREYLAKLISKLTPDHIKQLHKTIKKCFTKYFDILKKVPKLLQSSFESWFRSQPVKEISRNIEKDNFCTEHEVIIHSIKIMLEISKFEDTSFFDYVVKWQKKLLQLFSTGYIKNYLISKLPYLNDLLSISIRFSNRNDIKAIIREGSNIQGVANENIGVNFCGYFMNVYFNVLVEKPFLLMELGTCCVLLNDVVKYGLKKKCSMEQYENILQLVDQLWPQYSTQTTFTQKHALLLDLSGYPVCLDRDSNPAKWARDNAVRERGVLLAVLPPGEDNVALYRRFASSLPARLSELSDARADASMRALLDALASTANLTLLEIVMTLAAGDATTGWWDSAIESCMASLAARNDVTIHVAAYTHSGNAGEVWCGRVLVPLLRYSTPSVCERFLSTVLQDLLSKLRKDIRQGCNQYLYQTTVQDYTKAFLVLTVAFEKIPLPSLESPDSILYKNVSTQQSWFLVREVCKLGVTLRGKVPRPGEGAEEAYRQFQCAAYNAVCAGLCARRPDPRPYCTVLSVKEWVLGGTGHVPLPTHWNQSKRSRPTSIHVTSSDSDVTSLTLTRSRLFLRTLSECVLQYDLHDGDGESNVNTTQELSLVDNVLNSHECACTLTALLRHVSNMAVDWTPLVESLQDGGARMLVAQAIVNSSEELKPHADVLTPALFAMVADSADEENGKRVLNGLHVQVLQTLTAWSSPASNVSQALSHLVTTCLENRHRQGTFQHLLDVLTKFLQVYTARVAWIVFEPYVDDTQGASKILLVLQRLARAKIYLPELLPTLMAKMAAKQWELAKLSQLFGMALANCQNERSCDAELSRWRKMLEGVRTNVQDYVKMLYYAQLECAACCDEQRFRVITDLCSKISGPCKEKCLAIIASYISRNPHSSIVRDTFAVIELSELIREGGAALVVAREGLRAAGEGARRMVMQVADYCENSVVKTRKAALEVMLKAAEDIFSKPSDEPPPKLPRTDAASPFLDAIDSSDPQTRAVLRCISAGVCDKDGDIATMVREGVCGYLNSGDMGIRFIECFIICVYVPLVYPSKERRSLCACAAAMLEMYLHELRKHRVFKDAKLRDEPVTLSDSVSTKASRLLTMSRTYQGTFRKSKAYNRRTVLPVQDSAKPDIDVQIPIDTILETLLQFSKSVPESSIALLRSLRSALPPRPAPALARLLHEVTSAPPGDVTPLVIALAESCVQWMKGKGFLTAVDKLRYLTTGTEGETSVRLLYEEARLAEGDPEMFVLGVREIADVKMEEQAAFSVDDLTSVFGKLSNWDSLTIQKKRRVLNSGLPPLWTSRDDFLRKIKEYTGAETWFDKMLKAYKNEDRHNAMKWLSEVDRWPRKSFEISAVTEAVEWFSKSEDFKDMFSLNIRPADCLAEWAGKLMMRTIYLTSLELSDSESDERLLLSRSHELQWCERANDIGLSPFVLDCVKRNVDDLTSNNEALPWLRQKVIALREIGLERSHTKKLRKALDVAEEYTPHLTKDSSADVVLDMNRLILQLNYDLRSLSKAKVNDVISKIKNKVDVMSDREKKSMAAIHRIAFTYYDDSWDNDAGTVRDMCDILYTTPYNSDMYLAVILNRLENFNEVLSEETSKILLDKVQQLIPTLDDFTLEQLRAVKHIFPSRLLGTYTFMSDREDPMLLKYKQCLQLLCDAEYALSQYCEELKGAMEKKDAAQWKLVFDRMKSKIFENPYAGSDYQLLNKYKNRLYDIYEFESTPLFKTRAQDIFRDIQPLKFKRQTVLRMSQLCPALLRDSGPERDRCLGKLLALPGHVTLVTFEEKISVFTDSIRRPAVFVARCSDRSRSFLQKGEPLRTDAAALRVRAAAGALCGPRGGGYKVTPLSDDCGLIEYLEDHVRVRDLVNKHGKLDSALAQLGRPADDELILSPAPARLRSHRALSQAVDRAELRAEVRAREMYTRTLAEESLVCALLGLGDRHLQNILISTTSGAVVCVDWNALFQYGVAGQCSEPPARLTAALLAACDTDELESRVQKLLACLRESRTLFLAVVKISFKWMGDAFTEKYPYIESLVTGRKRWCDVTRDVISRSPLKYKRKYVELMDEVFAEWGEGEGSVEEQVSCLLRQCTDPRILSVTRSGWEPWV